MQTDRREKLAPLTLFYHWTIALFMVSAMGFGLYLESLTSGTSYYHLVVTIHKNVGLFIFLLASARIIWRYKNGFFAPVANLKTWEEKVARWTHTFLLVATIAMPISGMMMVLGYGCTFCTQPVLGTWLEIGPFPKIEALTLIGSAIHRIGSKIIIAVILFHAAAALKHHYWDRDDTLKRMLGMRAS